MCAEALANGQGGAGNWSLGFSWGILCMLGFLGLVSTGFVTLVVFGIRAEDSARQESGSVESGVVGSAASSG